MIEQLRSLFPKSSRYDIKWLAENEMGPNVLWLTEFLTKDLDISDNMRILDLGCGTAVSSIFLAKEYGATVWATDLWISPTENYNRIKEAQLEALVYPIYGEAHNLPFGEEFFDMIISVDAYHYFGTDEAYLSYITKYLKPGGKLGIVVPGIMSEFTQGIPDYLQPFWQPELYTFHSPAWWNNHFAKTGLVHVDTYDYLEQGWTMWRHWEQYLVDNTLMNPRRGDDLDLLAADDGRNLCFPRIIATKLTV
jgi:cyclopropane fatty-acyl-phospholipid synthase-like methyltransferase